MEEEVMDFEPVELDQKFLDEIEAKKKELLAKNPKTKIFVVVIDGDEEAGEKEHYVAYMKRPSIVAFSKYLSFSQNNQVAAMKGLAKDCFVDGDKELVEDDDLFMFGTMPQLVKVIEARQGRMVNFSKTGK